MGGNLKPEPEGKALRVCVLGSLSRSARMRVAHEDQVETDVDNDVDVN